MADRSAFLSMVRKALGASHAAVQPVAETGLSESAAEVRRRASDVRADMVTRGAYLLDQFATAAAQNNWRVSRAENVEHAAEVIAQICRSGSIKSVMRSQQEVFARVPIDKALATLLVDVSLSVAGGDGAGRQALKDMAFAVDCGLTGTEYAIAETGTVVIHPRAGVSRLVSLAPPVHIAIVERGGVIPTLDGSFLVERESLIDGHGGPSLNLISGPSRTGDIEATVVQGIHGPLVTHAVLIG